MANALNFVGNQGAIKFPEFLGFCHSNQSQTEQLADRIDILERSEINKKGDKKADYLGFPTSFSAFAMLRHQPMNLRLTTSIKAVK